MVTRLDVVGIGQKHAALHARVDLFHIVLEAAKRGDCRLRHDDVVAREAGMEALANDAFEAAKTKGFKALCKAKCKCKEITITTKVVFSQYERNRMSQADQNVFNLENNTTKMRCP